jgi:hypothetical protein
MIRAPAYDRPVRSYLQLRHSRHRPVVLMFIQHLLRRHQAHQKVKLCNKGWHQPARDVFVGSGECCLVAALGVKKACVRGNDRQLNTT